MRTNNIIDDDLEAVNVVDILMSNYRNGVPPSDAVKLRAYELGIDVETLKCVMEDCDESTRTLSE